MKLAICPIAWINVGEPNWPVAEPGTMLAEMREAGFSATEMSRVLPKDVMALREMLAAHDLRLAAAYLPVTLMHDAFVDEEMAKARAHLSFCAAMDAVAILQPSGNSRHWGREGPHPDVIAPTDAQWRRLADGLNRLGDEAQSQNLTLCVHPHADTILETPDAVEVLLAMTDAATVSLCFDSGHLVYGGGDPYALAAAWAPRIRHVHLKDVRGEVLVETRVHRWDFFTAVRHNVFAAPGQGQLDFARLLAPLAKASYGGWLSVEAEQDPRLAPPLATNRAAHGYLSAILETLPRH
ncbi:MAG: TIM barrel protein [Trueperaceae bacterium]|nr:TIM barrel protein [Trueperaceae bacterium]